MFDKAINLYKHKKEDKDDEPPKIEIKKDIELPKIINPNVAISIAACFDLTKTDLTRLVRRVAKEPLKVVEFAENSPESVKDKELLEILVKSATTYAQTAYMFARRISKARKDPDIFNNLIEAVSANAEVSRMFATSIPEAREDREILLKLANSASNSGTVSVKFMKEVQEAKADPEITNIL